MDNERRCPDIAEPLQTQAAYKAIKRAIISCTLEPGQQVTEEQLAERFGTGRGAVRSALKRLYQERLIQTISRQRYVVPPVTLKDARELFDIRLLLEPVAARRAAGRVEPATIARLRELCDSRYDIGDDHSASDFLAANTEFHVTIARASGNTVMAELISNLLDWVERLNHLSHALLDRNVVAHDEHGALVDALAAGDGVQANDVMAAQIQAAFAFVLEALTLSPSIQSANVTIPIRTPGRVGGDGPARSPRTYRAHQASSPD